jgi:hypothetical protein
MVGGGEDGQQVPDARVDVGCGALERGVTGLLVVIGRGRVGDAPVGPPRMGEFRTGLAGPVAQGDHMGEPAAGEGVQVLGSLRGDVDAERLAQHPDGMGVQARLGPATGTARRDPIRRVVTQQRLGDR